MSHFEAAFQKTIGVEGGYSNRPPDPETMFGITVDVARYHGYAGPMRDLPLATAKEIYKRDYWDPQSLDDVANLSHRVAEEVFDTGVNFGPGVAGRFLQAALNSLGVEVLDKDYQLGPLKQDGNVGAVTVKGFKAYLEGKFAGGRNSPGDRELVLLRLLNAQQGADYMRQAFSKPAKRQFMFGWILNRVHI